MDVSISSLLQPNQPKKQNDSIMQIHLLRKILHAINLESRDIFGSFRFCVQISHELLAIRPHAPCQALVNRIWWIPKPKREKKKTSNVEGVEKMRSILKIVYLEMKLGICATFSFFYFFFSLCCCSSWPEITSRQDTPWPRALETL